MSDHQTSPRRSPRLNDRVLLAIYEALARQPHGEAARLRVEMLRRRIAEAESGKTPDAHA